MDVEQKINNVISLAIKTQNYKIIVERLTFNERYSVLRMGYQDIVKYSVYPYLFTKEESEMLFEEVDNPLIKSIFLLNMSDEQKLDYVFNFDFKRVPDVIYLKSFTNIKLRTEAVLYIAENRDNDFDKHWEFYFELLDDDKKIELLSYMLLSKPINNKIGTTGKGRISLISIIKTFKQESLLKVIELFEQYKMFYIYDADCLDVILNVLDDSLKLKVLEKYLVFVSQNLNKFIFNQYNFISKFNADKKFEALELFIKYNTFNKYIMIGFFDKISPSEVCSYIEFIMKCSDQYGMNLIDESFFAEMINYYSFDVYKEILNKFVINSNVIDMVKVIKEIKELGNKLNVLDYLFSLDLKLDFELLFNYLKTLDFNGIDYDSNKYSCLVDVFVKKYSLDKKGLEILFNRFGYTVFKFLDNKNMQETACLSVEQLEKYIKLFDQKYVEINEGIINSVCNSFLQREFRLVQKDDYSIFSMFEQLLSKKNEDTYFCILDMLNHIRECVTLEKYLDDMGLDQFINKLISGNSESLDILHSITQEYIMRKREDYVKSRLKGIVNELNLDKKVEKDYFK